MADARSCGESTEEDGPVADDGGGEEGLGYATEDDEIEPGDAGDLVPERLLLVPEDSPAPNGRPLLAVGTESSGTTRVYEDSLQGATRPHRSPVYSNRSVCRFARSE
jgi:hypothetical protein